MIRKIKRRRDIITLIVLSAILAVSTVLFVYEEIGTAGFGQSVGSEYVTCESVTCEA